ncbi:MAG: KEOPS complex subunit Pcc1 [Candidatus Micrarchaeota archaeon]
MKSRCLIEVDFGESSAAEAALKAVSHETETGARSKTEIRREGGSLEISIAAQDVVAMRAAANACMRALQAFQGIEESK